MKNLSSNQKLAAGMALVALLIVGMIYFFNRGSRELVIVNGVEYKLLSYGKAEPQLSDGSAFDAYVLMVTYDDPNKGTTRGTIMVPASGIKRDLSLPENTVIWDKPLELEGKIYALARWNPSYNLPAKDKPALVPEDPLTREN